MAHYVICSICGKRFDRDKIQAVKSGARRYAHQSCKPDGELVPLPQVDPDLINLMDCIKEIYGDKANYALIKKQIKQYQEENNYSLSGIQKSLIYFYKVKGNSLDKSGGGIGIVPFVYKDAYNYYYSLFVAQSQNENKNLQQITSKIKEIIIKPPKIKKKIRLFNLGEDEVDDE